MKRMMAVCSSQLLYTSILEALRISWLHVSYMQLRRTQMAALGLPVVEEDEGNLKAIEDGVKDSGEKISEDFEERGILLIKEISDDL